MKRTFLRLATFTVIAMLAVSMTAQYDEGPFEQDPGDGSGGPGGGSCAICYV